MHSIDLTSLQPLVNDLVLGLLTALASFVAAKACDLLKAKRDGELGQILDKALGMGIAYATAGLKAVEADHATLSVKSDIVAAAANYAVQHVPDAIAALGLDGAHLERMVEARLGVAAKRHAGGGAMIDLIARLVGFLTQFGAAVAAFFWARNSADAKVLKATVEKQNAMLDAAHGGPRDQSDAVGRLRDGTF